MRCRRWMVVMWVCFAARLLFYAAMLPLWEGYDEWAHFAVVRHMAGGELLVSRDEAVPRDVEDSLQLAPVPWEMRTLPPPLYTQDGYWQLSAAERERREQAMRSMAPLRDGTGRFPAYEGLQPPLYYWMMTPVLWISEHLGAGLAGQVLVLRFFSSLVASLTIPLVWMLGRQVWSDDRLALGCAAVVAVMPGLALDVARVSNDCLAVVLFTALTWLLVKLVREGLDLPSAVWLGAVLGLGLLTKAYFLAALPAVGGILAYEWWRSRRIRGAMAAAWIAAVVCGWWYLRNLRMTGTLAGLSESVMVREVGTGEMARQAAGIHWVKAVDAILLSHLYFGGWSSLTVRSWMYHLFYAVILAAAVGLLRLLKLPAIVTLAAIYASFWLGQLYNVAILYISKGLMGSMGWYMYSVVGAEAALCLAGLRRLAPKWAGRWVAAGGAAMFALLDLYTVHGVAIPYYTGMIRHRANGSLEALHASGWRTVGLAGAVRRLTAFKSPLVPAAVLVTLWLLYLLGTAAAVACAGARECDSAANSQG